MLIAFFILSIFSVGAYTSAITGGFIGGVVGGTINKASSLIISEKRIYIQRETLNAENIKNIRIRKPLGIKVYQINTVNDNKYKVTKTQKTKNAIDRFCEINGTELEN